MTHQQSVQLLLINHNLLVATAGIRINGRELQSIQRVLPRQRLAPVTRTGSTTSTGVVLAGDRRQQRVMAKLVVPRPSNYPDSTILDNLVTHAG